MRKPDFFIVGAPKCGTSAMNEYLRQHPEIFIAEKKENHFFGSDLVFSAPRITKERYLSRFLRATGEKRVGEASVWYLYSHQAAAEIKAFCPSADIIILLRNPVDMIYSLHSQRLYNGNEDVKDFKAALAAETDRKRGLRLPQHIGKVMLGGYCYRDTAKYTSQVQRYLEVFGHEKVRIIIFDDLVADVAGTFRATCNFLGVDPNFQPEIHIVNPNKRVYVRSLQMLLRKSSAQSQWLAKKLPLGLAILGRIRRMNTKFVPRQPMDPQLKKELQADFLPEVERLSELLDRDLTHWCRP